MSAFSSALLALFICSQGALAQSVNLPGVDVLSSGYDALSWTTKFQIFDFASTPGAKVHVGANNKDYIAPAMVNVVTDGANSKKVEDSCTSISENFQEYYHTYMRSTKFDVGVDVGVFSVGLGYHKDVNEVYKAITTKGQAIGVSESWWGMYEIAAPPAFLLGSKLHPFFTQSKMYLQSIGTPKTEADQIIYNQVCCGPSGFGTHYVGSLIVGGRATVQTFVNNSFHSEHSHKEVHTQISLEFEYKKLKFSANDDAKKVHDRMMHDFTNSSHAKTTYQPDTPAIDSSDAPWLEWEKVAAENPTVVNTSVSSLANLFFESPPVMTHMQKTINFYLKNGKAPTLSELNGLHGELTKHPNPLVPGLQVTPNSGPPVDQWQYRAVHPRMRPWFESHYAAQFLAI